MEDFGIQKMVDEESEENKEGKVEYIELQLQLLNK